MKNEKNKVEFINVETCNNFSIVKANGKTIGSFWREGSLSGKHGTVFLFYYGQKTLVYTGQGNTEDEALGKIVSFHLELIHIKDSIIYAN